MDIDFDAPPPMDAATQELKARFEHAIEQLSNDFGRIVQNIVDHPRHNEKVERAKMLLTSLEQAVARTRNVIACLEGTDPASAIAEIVGYLERAAAAVQALADENAVVRGSIADQAAPAATA